MVTALIVSSYVIEALILILSIWIGYKRGLFSGLVRTAYLLISIPLSVLFAKLTANPLSAKLISVVKGIESESVESVAEATPETFQLLEALLTPIIFSVFFAVFYGILALLTLIKFKSLSNAVRSTKTGSKLNGTVGDKIGGSLIGVLNGVVLSAILLVPLCVSASALYSADPDALASLKVPGSEAVEKTETQPEKQSYIVVPSSLIANYVISVSDSDIPDQYAELRNQDIILTEEITDFINAAGKAKMSYSESIDSGDEKSKAIFSAIGTANSNSGNSKIIPSVFANIMRTASAIWERGDSFLGIKIESSGNSFAQPLIDKTLSTLKETDYSNVNSIVNTLMGDGESTGVMNNVVDIMEDTKSDSSLTPSQMLEEKGDIIADTLVQLGKDKDLQSVNSVVSEMGSDYIKEKGNKLFPENATDSTKKEVFDSLTNAITEHMEASETNYGDDYEANVNNISKDIKDTASEFKYDLSDAEATIVSVGLISYFESEEEVTTEGLMKYFGFPQDEIDRIKNAK